MKPSTECPCPLAFLALTGLVAVLCAGCENDYQCADGAECTGGGDGGTIGQPPCIARPCTCAIDGNCVHIYEQCRDSLDCLNYLRCTEAAQLGCADNTEGYRIYNDWWMCGRIPCGQQLGSEQEFEDCFCMGHQQTQ
jgi:hypothetical protein